MFERYTEQARRAVFFARYTAGHQRTGRITAAHLLIGLSWEGKTLSSEIGSLKERIPEHCALLGIQWPLGKASMAQLKTDLPLDNNAKMALAYAAQEADMDQQYWIDSDHLLRGLLRFPNEACSALSVTQLDLATVRLASMRHREEHPPGRTPLLRLAGFWFEPIKMAFVKLAILAFVGLIVAAVIYWVNWFNF